MSKRKQSVQWTMPEWASDLLMETLQMDSQSSAFDRDLRNEICQALETVETGYVQPGATSQGTACTPY